MDLKEKKVTVIGLARSGYSAAVLLKSLGCQVSVTDKSDSEEIVERALKLKEMGIDAEVGKHTQDFIFGRNLIVTSPGVPDNSNAIIWASEKKIPIISEVELAYQLCPAPIIAVTGTNGKSTTTTLIGQILKDAGKDVIVCGNIGNPFSGEIPKLKKESIVVLEISSFQLQRTKEFKPKVAVILNISQNHLDRHDDFQDYENAKAKILANQDASDYAVLNFDDFNVRKLSNTAKSKTLFFSKFSKVKGSFMRQGKMICAINSGEEEIVDKDSLLLRGEHNLENMMAAVIACRLFDVERDTMAKTLQAFKGLEHRFEFVSAIEGVDFINDSKATSVGAAEQALRSCDKPIILIAGGRDKGSDFSAIKELIRKKVKKLVLIGEAKTKIKKAISNATQIQEAQDLKDAVDISFKSASPNDVVLFSPMCASFDMFRDFEHRGETYKEIVRKLADERNKN